MRTLTETKIIETHSCKRDNTFSFRTEGMKWCDWRNIQYDNFECEIPHMKTGKKVKILEENGMIVRIGV
jgi:hypothetical protein